MEKPEIHFKPNVHFKPKVHFKPNISEEKPSIQFEPRKIKEGTELKLAEFLRKITPSWELYPEKDTKDMTWKELLIEPSSFSDLEAAPSPRYASLIRYGGSMALLGYAAKQGVQALLYTYNMYKPEIQTQLNTLRWQTEKALGMKPPSAISVRTEEQIAKALKDGTITLAKAARQSPKIYAELLSKRVGEIIPKIAPEEIVMEPSRLLPMPGQETSKRPPFLSPEMPEETLTEIIPATVPAKEVKSILKSSSEWYVEKVEKMMPEELPFKKGVKPKAKPNKLKKD